MGFFKKIFRRNKSSKEAVNTSSQPQERRRGRKAARDVPPSSAATDRESPTGGTSADPAVLEHATLNGTVPKTSRKTGSRRGPDLTDGSERVVLKQRDSSAAAAASGNELVLSPHGPRGTFTTPAASSTAEDEKATKSEPYSGGPVDLDASDLDEVSSREENINKAAAVPKVTTTRLSKQRLEEFTQQQKNASSAPLFTMASDTVKYNKTRFSAGHVAIATEDSDGESSSFNLSTDAEDTEYEDLRKRGVLRHSAAALGHEAALGRTSGGILNLDTSSMSQVSSPSHYNTDGETSIFPNLLTDDEGGTSLAGGMTHASSLGPTLSSGEDPPLLATRSKSPEPLTNGSPTKNANARGNASALTSTNSFGRRTFTSPKSPNSTKQSVLSTTTSSTSTSNNNNSNSTNDNNNNAAAKSNGFKDDFANFADFANFETTNAETAWPSEADNINSKKSPRQQVYIEAEKSPPVGDIKRSLSQRQMSSTSAVSELLAQAKSKKTSGRKSSSSVNSAPALTASYLRQSKSSSRGNDARSTDGIGTSVTDIIKSLEADNYSRASHKSGSSAHRRNKSSDAVSTHSRDAGSRSSSRMRRRRESERRRTSHGSPEDSSDSEGDNDAESWLMDEVTGALGPHGIAADLESLSARSNRSRSSGGGRSHKSHRSHRSHKSHRSSRRRNKSSGGESLSSHGSRRSRSSRYSHRSTRSYISQMSEQSRSVANDLLRLEMQLAMVNPEGSGNTSSNNNANGGSSSSDRRHRRTSRSSRASGARRSRMTVVAPPGKLGIILANKADSRGTVVSGVRTSSVLAEKIAPGDRIVAIDGEDVSLMTVSEITTIMARKADFDRALTILTTPKQDVTGSPEQPLSPRSGGEYRYRN